MAPPGTRSLPVSRSAGAPSSAAGRLRSIDLARGISVLLMIAAHATNALLDESWRAGWLWHQVNILFGFVAPAFLLLSGITLAISLDRDSSRGARRVAARRAGGLLLLGYWLQIPVLSLRQLIYCHRPEELARLFDVNILQAIAFSSLILLGIARLTSTPGRSASVALILALALALAAPVVWRSGLHTFLPAPLGRAVAPQPITTFPLVPYAAYALTGFGIGRLLLRNEKRPLLPLLIATVGIGSMIAGRILPPVPPHDDLWGSSIHHVIYRLGGSLLLLGAGIGIARHLPAHRTWLEWAGRSSLGFYLLHLVIIYGSPVNAGLSSILASRETPAMVAAIALGAVMVSASALLAWERLQSARPAFAVRCRWIGWGVFWVLFLSIP